jgi:flagellar biogenesis protein FliO
MGLNESMSAVYLLLLAQNLFIVHGRLLLHCWLLMKSTNQRSHLFTSFLYLRFQLLHSGL